MSSTLSHQEREGTEISHGCLLPYGSETSEVDIQVRQTSRASFIHSNIHHAPTMNQALRKVLEIWGTKPLSSWCLLFSQETNDKRIITPNPEKRGWIIGRRRSRFRCYKNINPEFFLSEQSWGLPWGSDLYIKMQKWAQVYFHLTLCLGPLRMGIQQTQLSLKNPQAKVLGLICFFQHTQASEQGRSSL